jgi:protein-glucosylgalactosylhydroxylysine glucosidase
VRPFYGAGRVAGSVLSLLWVFTAAASPVDRMALVTRHDVVLTNFDAANPLSVGNGGFCFTVDATGLQTFPEAFEKTIPLGTLSDWGWHTFPNPNNWNIDTFHFKEFPDLNGRLVPYADAPEKKLTPETLWLRENPHRLDLGQIGFVLKRADGSPATPGDLTGVWQKLDLWNGRIISQFNFDGTRVKVETDCDPALDAIAIQVTSPLIKEGRLAIRIRFPYGTSDTKTADGSQPDAHETILRKSDSNHADFYRKLDNDTYFAAAGWSTGATLTNTAKHEFQIIPSSKTGQLEVVCAFSPTNLEAKTLPSFGHITFAAQSYWNSFWKNGGRCRIRTCDLLGVNEPLYH